MPNRELFTLVIEIHSKSSFSSNSNIFSAMNVVCVCLSLTEMNPFLILETHKCINYTQNQLNPKIQKRPYYNHSYNYNSTMQYIVYSIVANILYSFAVQKSLTLCKHIRVGLNQLFARIAFLEGHYSDRDSLNASSHNRA